MPQQDERPCFLIDPQTSYGISPDGQRHYSIASVLANHLDTIINLCEDLYRQASGPREWWPGDWAEDWMGCFHDRLHAARQCLVGLSRIPGWTNALQDLSSLEGKPWDLITIRTLDELSEPIGGLLTRWETLDFSNWPTLLADLKRLTRDLRTIRGPWYPAWNDDPDAGKAAGAGGDPDHRQDGGEIPEGQPQDHGQNAGAGTVLTLDGPDGEAVHEHFPEPDPTDNEVPIGAIMAHIAKMIRESTAGVVSELVKAGTRIPNPARLTEPRPTDRPQESTAGKIPEADAGAGGDGKQPQDAGNGELSECLVTLQQAAAMVNRSKRTVEDWKGKKGFPRPRIIGGGGKPHEYAWSELRPVLEKLSGRKLPERFPAQRFRPT